MRLGGEPEDVVRAPAALRALLGYDQAIALKMREVLPYGDGGQLERRRELADAVAPVALQEGEDLSLGAGHSLIRSSRSPDRPSIAEPWPIGNIFTKH